MSASEIKFSRREAFSTSAKVAIGVVGAAIVGGVAYAPYQQAAVPQNFRSLKCISGKNLSPMRLKLLLITSLKSWF
ncbi:MAG: hypothetical protein QXZ17_10250 [Nitrososphaerota archaeon]